MVGTMNRSMAAMSGAWLRKKVRHPWLGGPRRLTMYLATLDCANSNPSLSSSPWMRGAPQSGFSTLIRRISTAQLGLDLWPPSPRARLPTPITAKAGVRELRPAAHLAPQNDQLMSKHRILSFKPALRPEWRNQNGQTET